MESFWSSLEQFFQDHRCCKQRMIYFRDIRPLCVGATPVPKGFYHMSNFLVSVPNLQARVTPTQNEWIEKPGSFNSKIHVSDQFDFQ